MRIGVRRVLAALAAVSIALPIGLAMVRPFAEAAGDEVLYWGRNQYDQLGSGALNPAGEPVPAPVSLPEGYQRDRGDRRLRVLRGLDDNR